MEVEWESLAAEAQRSTAHNENHASPPALRNRLHFPLLRERTCAGARPQIHRLSGARYSNPQVGESSNSQYAPHGLLPHNVA